jgi:C4-dicarboxylate transporter DctM subunit
MIMLLTISLVFAVLLIIGVPVGFGMGLAALVALWLDGGYPLLVIGHRMVNAVSSFSLVAVPLFILAGALAGETSIAQRLVRFADALVGHVRGGLGQVNVAASMFFGGISGSAVADTAALGSLLVPPMEKQGYSRADAGAVTICSSTIGVLIPPSIPMVLYGITVGESVGQLFLAGIVPGILVGLLLMVAVFTMAKRKKWPRRERRATGGALWESFKGAFLSLLLPIFLLGSIVSGLTTATEAGVIGVIYVLLLGGVVYRDQTLPEMWKILVNSAINTAVPLFILATTSVTAWIIAIERFPDTLVDFFATGGYGPWTVILLIILFLMFIGMFMDLVPALILFAPILLPVAQAAGYDPIHFGIIMIMALGIGLVTPPVGNCLYLGAVIARVGVGRLAVASLPFLAVNVFALLLVALWPALTMAVPRLFY